MKNILLITGSARKNGNSCRMADSFERAANEKGLAVKRIDATKLNIGECHGCATCYKTGKACTFDDDFNKIADDIISSDGIVIATPLYWYTFPAKVKAIIDKFYSLYVGGHMFQEKKCALMACGEEALESFQGIEFAFDKTFELMGAEIVGKVIIPGVSEEGAIDNTDGIEKAKDLVRQFTY